MAKKWVGIVLLTLVLALPGIAAAGSVSLWAFDAQSWELVAYPYAELYRKQADGSWNWVGYAHSYTYNDQGCTYNGEGLLQFLANYDGTPLVPGTYRVDVRGNDNEYSYLTTRYEFEFAGGDIDLGAVLLERQPVRIWAKQPAPIPEEGGTFVWEFTIQNVDSSQDQVLYVRVILNGPGEVSSWTQLAGQTKSVQLGSSRIRTRLGEIQRQLKRTDLSAAARRILQLEFVKLSKQLDALQTGIVTGSIKVPGTIPNSWICAQAYVYSPANPWHVVAETGICGPKGITPLPKKGSPLDGEGSGNGGSGSGGA